MKQTAAITWFYRAARLCLAAAMALAAWPGRADEAPPKQARMENRFLFIIETTLSMRSRTNGVEEAMMALLNSGLHGELRKGDTLGLWSYGEQLRPDFPMQVWSEENKGAIAETVQRYLRHLRYERWGHLERVWPAVQRVLAKSERLTVIFIYDGEDTVRGTPFDKDINDLQKHYRREFRSGHLPFVTILAGHYGEFFDYTINYPGSIAVPHTADPLPPPQTNAPPALAPAAPVEPKPARRIEIVMRGTPAAVPAPPPVAAAPAALTNQVVAEAPPAAVPAKPAEPAPPAAPPPQPAAPVAVQMTNGAAAPASPAAPPPPVSAPAPVAPAASAPAPVSPVRPPGPPGPQPGLAPATLASTGAQAALFVCAISLLTIAVALVILLVRRSRGRAHPSLITQSIDRSR